jgi:GNAT superfamily N-acetyltransferase
VSKDITVAPLKAPPARFRSGREEFDRWLGEHGWAATRAGSARVYLARRGDGVVGYFALAAGSVEAARAGTRMRAGMPRHPIPTVLLARLAVSETAQGLGIGRGLVRHSGQITIHVAKLVAVRALVVDALDEPTGRFYEHLGFEPNDANPTRLELLVKDLEALALDERGG